MALSASSALLLPRALRAFYSTFHFNPTPSQFQPPPPPEPHPSTILFVSGLNKHTTSEGLFHAFAKFGEVLRAKVMTDRVSGYSKGFGFVKYVTIKEAEAGIKGMNRQFLDGWVISAEYSKPKQRPGPLRYNYIPPPPYV